ncbi:MAG: hypothetical protein HFE41_00965 [Clostridia bacterium]|jgi:hypothetical protein|nr:hypothetical protein [Clostridia bacterium]
MPDEEFKPNIRIYNGDSVSNDPEKERQKKAAQRARQAQLPKFTLPDGETLYIDREEIRNLNSEYFQILDDMRKGSNVSFEDLESLMRSVVLESYKNEITQMQEKGKQQAYPRKIIEQEKQNQLKPNSYRKWWQRKWRPNKAMTQCLKLAGLEAAMEFAATEEEIARQTAFIYGEKSPENIKELYEQIIYKFIPVWRRRKFVKKHGKRLMDILTDYTQQILCAALLREDKNCEQSTPALTEEQVPSVNEPTEQTTPEVTEAEEYEEDELDELYELEKPKQENVPAEEEFVAMPEPASGISMVPMSVEGSGAEESQQDAAAENGEDIKEQGQTNDS